MLRENGLLAAALLYGTSALLVFLRVLATGSASLAFLPWNLTLAFVPYALSLAALRLAPRRWPLLPLGLASLLFLPNAFYVATDLIHLRPRAPVPAWYDVGLLALCAGTGWLLGLLAMRIWKRLLAPHLSGRALWAGTGVVALLSGYGIYLGRFLRWNSWDLLRAPGKLLVQIASHLIPPWDLEIAGVTAFFGALIFVTHLAYELIVPEPARQQNAPEPRLLSEQAPARRAR
jgi:uncharacterized membrane protein